MAEIKNLIADRNMNNSEKLLEAILVQLSLPTTPHPLQEEMLKECCEQTALDLGNKSFDIQLLSAMTAFVSCNKLLQATVGTADQMEKPDVININYRGKLFVLDHEDRFRLQSAKFGNIE